MNLIRAETKAKYLVKELESFCDRIEIVGNIRRRKDSIDNIQILLAPKGALLLELMGKIVELNPEAGFGITEKKIIILKDELESIMAELWFTTPEKWPVMLLIKTGGNKNNKKMATLCEQKKWRL